MSRGGGGYVPALRLPCHVPAKSRRGHLRRLCRHRNAALTGQPGRACHHPQRGTSTTHVVSVSFDNVTLDGLTITGGHVTGNGGGVYNTGNNLVLTRVTLSANSATQFGGGVYNTGSMILDGCTLYANTVSGSLAAVRVLPTEAPP